MLFGTGWRAGVDRACSSKRFATDNADCAVCSKVLFIGRIFGAVAGCPQPFYRGGFFGEDEQAANGAVLLQAARHGVGLTATLADVCAADCTDSTGTLGGSALCFCDSLPLTAAVGAIASAGSAHKLSTAGFAGVLDHAGSVLSGCAAVRTKALRFDAVKVFAAAGITLEHYILIAVTIKQDGQAAVNKLRGVDA